MPDVIAIPSPGLKATLSPSDGERAGVRGFSRIRLTVAKDSFTP